MLALTTLLFTLVSFYQCRRYSTVCNHYRLFKDRYVHSTDPIAARALAGLWGLFACTGGLILTLANLDLLPGYWAI